MAQIAELLADPDCRMLTLVGPGGSGKTRLALETATAQLEANRYEYGVFFVSLAPLESAESIVTTVADALGFQFFGGAPPQQQLLGFLRQRNLLLIMDNYEHLLACPEPGRGNGADLVSDIIHTAPEVKVLATSRALLNVGGEHRFQVEGMDYPHGEIAETPSLPRQAQDALRQAQDAPPQPQDTMRSIPLTPQDAAQYSAVRLFTECAQRARPDFQLHDDNLNGVLDICRLTEGLPLAIRLAAAWVAVLTPADIAAEISQNIDLLTTQRRDVPERQRSVRATFDHSWSMLSEREREVMQALSVFRGGFAREAAQQVSGASLAESMALVDKSLVHPTPGGYFELHELLRGYAAEKLGETPSDREAVHDRHCAYYAAALQAWGSDIKGPRQLEAVKELGLEIGNARAAWNWAVQGGNVPCLDQALEGLFLFIEWRGRYLEGEAACRDATSALETRQSTDALRVRVKILAWEGVLNRHMGRADAARQLAEESLALLGAPELANQDTRRERATILGDLGWVMGYGNPEEGQRLLRQSLALAPALGDRWETAYVLFLLSGLVRRSGGYREAQEMLEESLATYRALGDRRGIAYALEALSQNAADQWQHKAAERLAQESVALHREIGHLHMLATSLIWSLGWTLYERGKFAEHHAVLEEALEICNELGVQRHLTSQALANLGLVELHLGRYQNARAHAEASLGIIREYSESSGEWSLHSLGKVALAEGAYAAAQTLLQQAADYWRDIGRRTTLGRSLAFLAIASRGLGQIPQARRHLYEALWAQPDIGRPMPLLVILPAIALILVDQGEAERAVEIYALASRYPFVANSRWYGDVVGRHITAAAATLRPEVVAAAQERGRARDPRVTAEEYLHELGG